MYSLLHLRVVSSVELALASDVFECAHIATQSEFLLVCIVEK